MPYIETSNDIIMRKRKTPKKPVKTGKLRYSKAASGRGSDKPQAEDARAKYFIVERGGRQKRYAMHGSFGYFIASLRRASNLVQVGELIEAGLPSKEVEPIIKYLDLKVPEIAKAAAVSPSTVSRWREDTSIGSSGSNQFFRIDEVIRKGVDLFGGLEGFKGWLQSPNLALGNQIPSKLITSQIGVEMVDEALDALHYGNVM
jgi:putative toxin-antitoxin system antitoxin component (TIGR02293 family)